MKLLIFAGTFEGRALCEYCSDAGVPAAACTATQYGADCLAGLPGITVYAGRQNAGEMLAFIKNGAFDTVVDATHPYANEVTDNIITACEAAGAEYVRLLREALSYDHFVTVPDTATAVAYLASVHGNVLVTTGSKELHVYCDLPHYKERLFVRVLPSGAIVNRCHELGFDEKHIIAMQGPFSHQLNMALLRQFDCQWLVTKNTGKTGGLDEKISAAEASGASVVMIDRPLHETGLSFKAVLQKLNITVPDDAEKARRAS